MLYNKPKTNRKSIANYQQVVLHESTKKREPTTNPQHLKIVYSLLHDFLSKKLKQLSLVLANKITTGNIDKTVQK